MGNEKFPNKNNIFLLWIFILITAIHVIYATLSVRIAYMDGAPEILHILNSISNNAVDIFRDSGHTRYFSNALMQLPVFIGYWTFALQTKYSLAAFYSFCWLAIAPGLLVWKYKLSKRTQNYDTFVLGLSLYSLVFLLHAIFGVVETPMTILFVLIVYNYITAKIDYTNNDKIILVFLIILLFSSQELVLFCGPIIFITSLFYAIKEPDKSNKLTKIFAGTGMLFASLYIFFYAINVQGNKGEALRYIEELTGIFPNMLQTNFLITALGLVILTIALLVFKGKKEIPKRYLTLSSLIIFSGLFYMARHLDLYVNPILEGHYRVIDTIFFPVIFLILAIKDLKNIKFSDVIQNNIISIVVLVGIALTLWQMDNTYWFNKNIDYMQNELNNCNQILYIPDEHEPPISKFFDNNKRNYIWHADYPAMSILFSKDYEIKKLLSVYNKPYENSNATERELLFADDKTLSLPFVSIDIKSKFWDLTKVAKAINKYNKENNIKTNEAD